jgi:cytochrome c-type biogenesis protein CcmF
MIPELGHFALIIALAIAVAQAVVPLIGAHKMNAALMAFARPAAQGQFVFVAIAFGCLAYSFASNDFSVANVAHNSNSKLPWFYRIAATWGSHEGSLLLWVLMLSVWSLAVTVFSRQLPEAMHARVIAVLGFVSVGFLLFMLLTSNPFLRLVPIAADGRDLNPLLQDFGMVIHPPMLYMGYVGFSVAFAFALSALIGGRLDAAWARWSRPWTTAAWCFLTAGIALGSWWAYRELGWGGWWFWDPVENASFMPWLVGTALMHSLAVTEKRGSFKAWTVLLAITAFSLSLLGTFLVRSGVLTSVHAFATDPARGVFILIFLCVVIGGSLALFAWRAAKVGLGESFDVVSREAALLINNVLLMVAAGAVMLGTLYPLFLDALGRGKISVGPPYFDFIFPIVMAPALFLMGIGPLAKWKQDEVPSIATRLTWAGGVALVTAILVPLALGRFSLLVAGGVLLGAWVAFSGVVNLRERLRAMPGAKLRNIPRAFFGMLLAHWGVAVFVIGVSLVKGYESEQDLRMAPGEFTRVGGSELRFKGVSRIDGPNYTGARGELVLERNGKTIDVLHPEKRRYLASGQVMTEAAIETGVAGDVYVALGDDVGEGAWTVRVYRKPFVTWIWGGCVLMVIGGALALSDRRYRLARRAAQAPAHATQRPA